MATLLGVIIVAALGMVAAGGAPSASACDINNHCYAQGEADGPANYGEQATVSIACLYAPNRYPNFVTNELWDGNGTYWVEAGSISGYGYNNPNYFSRELFWEDSRPNGGGVHYHPVQAINPANYFVEMYWIGNNTWKVDVNGNWYQSTSEPLFGQSATTAGTEYTFGSGSGFRDVGQVLNIQWRSSNGVWHAEGGSMHADPPLGSGAFITPSYDSFYSNVSWNGPC